MQGSGIPLSKETEYGEWGRYMRERGREGGRDGGGGGGGGWRERERERETCDLYYECISF